MNMPNVLVVRKISGGECLDFYALPHLSVKRRGVRVRRINGPGKHAQPCGCGRDRFGFEQRLKGRHRNNDSSARRLRA